MKYDQNGIRHTAFAAERRLPCGRTVQAYSREMTPQEIAEWLLKIDLADSPARAAMGGGDEQR